MKFRNVVVLQAALIASAACSALDKLITVQQSVPYATISMNAQASGNKYVTTPSAFFYRAVGNTAVNFTTVGTPNNTCNVRPISNLAGIDTLPLVASPVDAGPFVTVQLSGLVDSLLAPSAQSVGYRLPPPTVGRPFVPGDLATFSWAGNSSGFPAASISLQTAEAFTMPQAVFAPSGQDLQLSWTPAATSGSVMNVTISYPVANSAQQIYCQFVDDGAASIPASFFSAFPNIVAGNPVGVDAIRMRTTLVQLPGSGAIINVISVFEVPNP